VFHDDPDDTRGYRMSPADARRVNVNNPRLCSTNREAEQAAGRGQGTGGQHLEALKGDLRRNRLGHDFLKIV
jgi:hypothetical protein